MYMGQELIWSREPSGSSTLTLSLRDDVVATLSWENWSSAIAIVGTKSWSFNQTGIWRPQYAVIEGFLDTPVAFFKHQLRGDYGTLTWNTGRSVGFKRIYQGMTESQWSWFTPDGPLLLFNNFPHLVAAVHQDQIFPSS